MAPAREEMNAEDEEPRIRNHPNAMPGLNFLFQAGQLRILWRLHLQSEHGKVNCVEREKSEQERGPGHTGDATELCVLRVTAQMGSSGFSYSLSDPLQALSVWSLCKFLYLLG